MKSLLTLLTALFAVILLALVVSAGFYVYLAPQLPSVDALKDVRLQVPLRVYARGGELMAEFGEERRMPVPLAAVPDLLRKAILAAEDDRFYSHPGVDYQGMLRAVVHLLKTGEKTQGGSTITMQVARNFFLTRERTFARKAKEILLALKIERELSKDDIFQLYLNKIYFGNRAYGVAAAAQVYYGKALDELNLAEMAMIAGLPKAPSRFNPIANAQRAAARRDYVLGRMHELRYIDETAFRATTNAPVTARLHTASVELEAPYVAEMARAEMFEQFGESAYTGGYSVITTVDPHLQRVATIALRVALHDYDERHGFRGPIKKLGSKEGRDAWLSALEHIPRVGDLTPAVVTQVADKDAQILMVREGEAHVPWEGVRWARRYISEARRGRAPNSARDVLAPGDVIYLRREDDGDWRLAQIPQAEGALVAMSAEDGALLAVVGGFDFYQSTFNRAVQAKRQPGSSFKPFIYSAALEKGFTPATTIYDAPVVIEGGAVTEEWRPENYSGRFYGPTRLREALVHSRNLVSIRLLRSVGIDYAIDYVKRFGFAANQLPRGLSLALGTGTATPGEMAAAYAVFATGGYRLDPHFVSRILGPDGTPLWEAPPIELCEEAPCPAGTGPHRVLRPQNAFLMTSMMQDVVRRGTGRRARELGRQDLAGKTGTTNDHHDAWFCGFNRKLVVTTWVGFDQPRSLGNGETGSRAALPMWIAFMREALQGIPDEPPAQPMGLVTVRIDPATGLLAHPEQRDAMFEVFDAASVPTRTAAHDLPAPTAEVEHSMAIPEQLF